MVTKSCRWSVYSPGAGYCETVEFDAPRSETQVREHMRQRFKSRRLPKGFSASPYTPLPAVSGRNRHPWGEPG